MGNSQHTGFVLFSLFFGFVSATLSYFLLTDVTFSYGMFSDAWLSVAESFVKGRAVTLNYELIISTGIGFIVAIVALLLNPFSKYNRYGDAQWASRYDIKKMGLNSKTGMILGKYKGKYLRTKDYLSVLFLAPPNSRKSVGLIMPNLFSNPDSIIVYDVKFDLLNETSKRRSEFSDIIRFSPGLPDSSCFNPLAKQIIGNNWDDIVGDVETLASIIYPAPKSDNSHWVMGSRIMFVFFALKEIEEHGETSIPSVRENALEAAAFNFETDDGEVHEGVQACIKNYLDENEEGLPKHITLSGNDLSTRPKDEFGSVFSTFTTGLSDFGDSRCARAFSSCDFTPKTLREKRTTVYVCVSDKDSRRFSTALRILFETFNSYYLSNKPTKEEFGITNLLDEFPRLGRMDVIMDAPALQRSNRVRSIFCAQSEAQIKEIYGNDKLSVVTNSCAFQLYTAQNDDALNKKISEGCGERTDIRTTTSRNGSNANISEEKLKLILPQEVGSLPVGEMIIWVQNFRDRPLKCKQALFYEDRIMEKMVGSIEDPIIDDDEIQAEPN